MYANTSVSGQMPESPEIADLLEAGMARYGEIEENLTNERDKTPDVYEVLAFGHMLDGSEL